MADILTIATTVTVAGSPSDKFYQPITEAIDVSAYKTINLQVTGYAIKNNGGGGAPVVTVTILTSMDNRNDDGSWTPIDSATLTVGSDFPIWAILELPQTGAPLFRFIRWQCELTTNSAGATFSIQGLAYAT